MVAQIKFSGSPALSQTNYYLNKSSRILWIFSSWKITSFDLLSVQKKKNPASCHMKAWIIDESKFSHHMRNMGNAAEYFMFFKYKSKILVCLCILYNKKNWGLKIRALKFFLLIILIWVEMEIRLLRLTEIPSSFSGKLLWFQRNCSTARGVTWDNFCWVCAAGLSMPLLHYSLFCGQLKTPY